MAKKVTGGVVISHRGKQVNLTALKAANGKMLSAGNAHVNARGDVLGKNGKIIKTREQIASEYYSKNPKAVPNPASVALNQPTEDMLAGKKSQVPNKPEKFIDKMAKKNDLDTLKQYDLGAVHEELKTPGPEKK